LSCDQAVTKNLSKPSSSLISKNTIPSIAEAINLSPNIENLKDRYESVIKMYRQAIIKQKPDLILINGTYYLPWCLLHASRGFDIPTIIHYHGSITKETESWNHEAHKKLFRDMECDFDDPKLFYIFPSQLTKKVVEEEVFYHPIKKYSILPNPVPLSFFDGKPRGKRKKIGVVSRWTKVKNPDFISRLAYYNNKRGNEFTFNLVSDVNKKSKQFKDMGNIINIKKPMDNKHLGKFYSSMGILISPSHFETYGNVAMEALASGVPALVSPHMGVAETFRELGLDDWITDFDSVRDVYEKIKKVSGQAVPLNARLQLQEKHSPEYLHGKMLTILNSI
jgi:glycosyltransferase involved in cell wall biosynthesis